MNIEQNNRLTASEITNLWNSYLGNTMAQHESGYFLKYIDDQDLRGLIEDEVQLAAEQVQEAKRLLIEDGQPLPDGFTEHDVHLNTPHLYKDNIILLIKYTLAQDGMAAYSTSLATSIHSDVREFYLTYVTKTAQFFNKTVDIMEKKGLSHPKLHIPTPDGIEKVHKQSFLGGWFSKNRSLNSAEILQLHFHFTGLAAAKEFYRSFAQTVNSKELKQYFERGGTLVQKHLNILHSHLAKDELPQLPTWESEITDSTSPPFSERLMLFKLSVLGASAAGKYGVAISSVMRKDLSVDLAKMMAEFLQYGEDGLNLMIERGYLDQVPLAKN